MTDPMVEALNRQTKMMKVQGVMHQCLNERGIDPVVNRMVSMIQSTRNTDDDLYLLLFAGVLAETKDARPPTLPYLSELVTKVMEHRADFPENRKDVIPGMLSGIGVDICRQIMQTSMAVCGSISEVLGTTFEVLSAPEEHYEALTSLDEIPEDHRIFH